uniref:Ribonuclease H-like domain-containing protein n=1 Tax=Tanacetum cinerariifolium TaxID=118510 RepID=A0A6L2MF61_TANCI|nr:ribonuclease H-like domain-containing protein [Tanacetum cinerariifolium]
MWILGSLSDSLQEQVVTTPGNAKALWDHLKDLFHDNKDAQAINLDNELRSVKIGKMSVNEYCTKIKSMENRLKNLDCDVREKNLVIYAVNGLDSRFATLVEIIHRILLIYVDDIILTASSPALLQQIVDSLHKDVDMTDLGALNYFLGISAVRHPTGLFFLRRIETDSKLGPDGVPVQDLTLYRSLAGGLRSTSGYCVFLGDNLLSWSVKRQHTISCSSAEAEYRGVAKVVAETAWICNLLYEIHSPFLSATLVYCDNVSEVYMSANPVQHQRTKHIEIDIQFVHDMVKAGHVRVLHVHSRYQYADIFTKGLPSALFEDFRSSLSVCPPPAQTTGAY